MGCFTFRTNNNKFNIVGYLKLLRIIFPYLPFTDNMKMALFKPHTTDVDVHDFNDMLVYFVIKELALFGCDGLTTTGMADMLVNVNLAKVTIVNCPDINIDELRNIYPAITFDKQS